MKEWDGVGFALFVSAQSTNVTGNEIFRGKCIFWWCATLPCKWQWNVWRTGHDAVFLNRYKAKKNAKKIETGREESSREGK